MPDANSYIAITIGPILDTMSLASKPAGLWASSYLFSYISRSLCEKIKAAGIAPENFVTPYFPADDADYQALFCRKDGVGLFHDHIIFKDSDKDGKSIAGKLGSIRDDVIADAAETFGIDHDFLCHHVMIAILRSDVNVGNNPILYFGNMFDCVELSKSFKAISTGRELPESFKNDKVRSIGTEKLKIAPEQWQLIKKHSDGYGVKSIEDIAAASNAEKMKKNDYFCILRADVDNAGTIISSLSAADAVADGDKERGINENLRCFSKACFRYCEQLAEVIKVFGGVTIYAGGDDLLALLPCEGDIVETDDQGDQKRVRSTVFDLIERINSIFKQHFKNYIDSYNESSKTDSDTADNKKPSVSYGLFISYKKYPLYEALERSTALLFDVAKHTDRKDCIAVELRKHSGQSSELVISNTALPYLIDLISKVDVIGNAKDDDNDAKDKALLSAAQKLMLFEQLFAAAKAENSEDLFKNTFDDDYHFDNCSDFLHKTLPKFYNERCLTGQVRLYESDKPTNDLSARALGQVLRTIKFFVEKGSEQR